MTYDQLMEYLCECCENNIPISYKSLRDEIENNKYDIMCTNFKKIENRWGTCNHYFYIDKQLNRYDSVYCIEIYRKGFNNSKNIFTFYTTPIIESSIYILSVAKYAWSYEMQAINKERISLHSTELS